MGARELGTWRPLGGLVKSIENPEKKLPGQVHTHDRSRTMAITHDDAVHVRCVYAAAARWLRAGGFTYAQLPVLHGSYLRPGLPGLVHGLYTL